MDIKNPILTGMYPDPSICKGAQKYYMVNSTFSYAPGIPIFESDNLLEWTQIGNILESREQLDLEQEKMSGGIFAPTIRYWNGYYYVITTNQKIGKAFVVTATNPEGPWSLPTYIEGADGIDPSLFWEGDKCYYVGQRTKADALYYGDCEIWMQELDIQTGKLWGEVHVLWDGAAKHAIWPEGPHLYKKDGYYYLMIAEGGTAHEHSVCVARSKEMFGPYESCKNNPVFTHRHLGMNYPIQNIGHADWVEGPDGDWYAVMLGTRPVEGKTELGRETFMVPISWEEEWPVFYPGEGKIPVTESILYGGGRSRYVEWQEKLDLRCVMLRNQLEEKERRVEEGRLHLHCGSQTLSDMGTPSYIGVRLEEHRFDVSSSIKFVPTQREEAGLAIFYDQENYLVFTLCQADGHTALCVKIMEKSMERTVSCVEVSEGEAVLRIQGDSRKLAFYLERDQEKIVIADNISIDALTTEIAGGFIGCTAGVYATAREKNSTNSCIFGTLELCYS